MHKLDVEKADKLYDYIDASSLYNCPVNKEDRSLMNVSVRNGNPDLDKKFVAESKVANLTTWSTQLHRRNARRIYNAMPMEGVDALIDFMKKFEEENK